MINNHTLRDVLHKHLISGKLYLWFILILVLNYCSLAQAQNMELASELKKINDSILNVTGVSLGTLAVLSKYEEGSYYPEWLLKERRDISRLESLKENGNAIVWVMLGLERGSEEMHDKDEDIVHSISGTSKTVYDFRVAKGADAAAVLKYILRELDWENFDGHDIERLDQKRQELERTMLDIAIDNDKELANIEALMKGIHNTRHTYNVHINVPADDSLLSETETKAIFSGADSLEILISEGADAQDVIRYLYDSYMVTQGMSTEDKDKLFAFWTRISSINKERARLEERINELEDEIQMINLKVTVLERSGKLTQDKEQEIYTQVKHIPLLEAAI